MHLLQSINSGLKRFAHISHWQPVTLECSASIYLGQTINAQYADAKVFAEEPAGAVATAIATAPAAHMTHIHRRTHKSDTSDAYRNGSSELAQMQYRYGFIPARARARAHSNNLKSNISSYF